jgi:uncharacterized phage protein (TIGR02216 family)
MAVGLGLLRLEPRAFWSMTPTEFAAAARAILGPERLQPERPTRSSLSDLIAQFPDQIPDWNSRHGQ